LPLPPQYFDAIALDNTYKLSAILASPPEVKKSGTAFDYEFSLPSNWNSNNTHVNTDDGVLEVCLEKREFREMHGTAENVAKLTWEDSFYSGACQAIQLPEDVDVSGLNATVHRDKLTVHVPLKSRQPNNQATK
jgi:HSP20 family molecular chaperone IbpA